MEAAALFKNNIYNDWSEKWTDKVQIFSIHTPR